MNFSGLLPSSSLFSFLRPVPSVVYIMSFTTSIFRHKDSPQTLHHHHQLFRTCHSHSPYSHSISWQIFTSSSPSYIIYNHHNVPSQMLLHTFRSKTKRRSSSSSLLLFDRVWSTSKGKTDVLILWGTTQDEQVSLSSR